MNVLSILGGNAFVMFNKEIAREVSVNGAIIFGQLCSSHESFGSKDMLTTYQNKEYFFLTSEVIEEETALTYKQQLKAIKDLETAGYIQTVIMGSPAKKYFHITDKIFEQFKSSSDKKEDLKQDKETEKPEGEQSDQNRSYDKRETQALTKEQSKPLPFGQAYKEIKEKEQHKDKIIKNNNLEEEKAGKITPRKVKFQSEFSVDEIRQAYRFIAPQMHETFNELDFNDDFKNRFVCYMKMAGMKYVSPKEIRVKNIEIEKDSKEIIDRALYVVKGIAMKRQSSDADLIEYKMEKARKDQKRKKELEEKMKEKTTRTVPFYNWLEQ
ncbi:hypothetical protein HMPREF3291_08665 [Bacillus sp. HMSC76G11]|nr:hypothetical protein HMPREF3291_08665 [Bacillus sp. HMSC76G11]